VVRALVRVAFGLALAGAVLWFALPVAASSLAGAAVGAAGVSAQDLSTIVIARPPLKLLLLEADALQVGAGPGTWRGLHFGRLDVTLEGLRLGAPPGTVDGRIDDLEFADGSGASVRADAIVLSGSASTPDVRVELGLADLSAVIGRKLPEALGGGEARIQLAPPDGVRIVTAGGELSARIVLRPDGGLSLVVTPPAGSAIAFALLEPGPALPVRIATVTIEGDVLVLRGIVDARALGL
jgi:hypothetical protein